MFALMAGNPYKNRHFPCEALNQTWAADRGIQKLEKEAEKHRTKFTFPIKMSNKSKCSCLAVPAAGRTCMPRCDITVNCRIDAD